jgi:hypothetical protein
MAGRKGSGGAAPAASSKQVKFPGGKLGVSMAAFTAAYLLVVWARDWAPFNDQYMPSLAVVLGVVAVGFALFGLDTRGLVASAVIVLVATAVLLQNRSVDRIAAKTYFKAATSLFGPAQCEKGQRLSRDRSYCAEPAARRSGR